MLPRQPHFSMSGGKQAVPIGRQAQQKLERVVQHAARVFYEKGYEGASMRDISRASGVSLAGLYYYVASKQQLLYLIQAYTFKSVLARLEERLEGVSEPVEKLRILVHNHLDYFLKHPVEMKVLSHEDEALEGAYRKEVLQIKRRYYGIASGIFEEMRARGITRRVDRRVAVLSLFGMMNWVYTWHRPGIDPRADTLAESITGMFLHGVTNGRLVSRRRVSATGRARRIAMAGRAA
jgi:TetR/AcrR family transcriptional regulator, cholesterol catabolism regulator